MEDIEKLLRRRPELESCKEDIQSACDVLINCFRSRNQVLLCGNGGSASDAQHIASELSGRFYLERRPLFAEALHVNSSFVTAVANDYGYDNIYSRYHKAKRN